MIIIFTNEVLSNIFTNILEYIYLMRAKTNNYPSVFSRRLSSLRTGRHLTQTDLAEQVGMTREMISYLESRAVNPTLDQIRRFSDFFCVSADEFIYDREDGKHKPGPKSTLEKQVEQLQKLPVSKQKLISDMIAAVVKS